MALKSVLTSLDGLSDELKKEYKEKDGKFYLGLEGLDEHHAVGALKRAKDHEKTLRQKAEDKLREAEDKVTAHEDTIEGLRVGSLPKSDVDALKKSYDEKLKKQEDENKKERERLNGLVEKHLLDGEARRIATDISTAPDLLLPHIRSRLALDATGTELVISVLGSDGKPSASSLDDLSKELLSNKSFAPILIGSKASGGGANGGSGGGSASSRNKPFKDLTEAERTAWFKDDPEGFRKAAKDAHATASF